MNIDIPWTPEYPSKMSKNYAVLQPQWEFVSGKKNLKKQNKFRGSQTEKQGHTGKLSQNRYKNLTLPTAPMIVSVANSGFDRGMSPIGVITTIIICRAKMIRGKPYSPFS